MISTLFLSLLLLLSSQILLYILSAKVLYFYEYSNYLSRQSHNYVF